MNYEIMYALITANRERVQPLVRKLKTKDNKNIKMQTMVRKEMVIIFILNVKQIDVGMHDGTIGIFLCGLSICVNGFLLDTLTLSEFLKIYAF